ncbi:MAG: Rne/Rng family ribonuclease [Pseudomonadota bacterium]
MAEELLINVNPFETRVAMVAHGHLQEIHVARSAGYSITGNIYIGRVERIVPGMQAAFVDVGLARPAFLHARDIDRPRIMTADNENQRVHKLDIRDLLHDGQHVMVQVEKDPISSKGARLSTQLALASKYLVLMPNEQHIGISQRIDEEVERERLRTCLTEIKAQTNLHGGIIARTASEGVGGPELAADLQLLQRIWERIQRRSADGQAPCLIFEELPLHTRMIRDLAGPATENILIDDESTYQRIRSYVEECIPGYAERLHHYTEKRPLFERHGVEDEVSRALEPRVALKSGGSLVIEQTEAMISIDVNTGGFLGGSSLEETVFRANMEAAAAIPRQLRLRNLGGIIVIDFIDMEDEEHQRQVMRTLEKAVELDPARTRLEGFSSLGLVQMSRKRTRESLAQSMCSPCASCDGVGLVRSAESTSIEVMRALAQDFQARCRTKPVEGEYMIRATEAVVDRLLDEDAEHLAQLGARIQRDIRIQLEPSYAEGEFDIVLVQNVAR